jgi:hypothetical protein
MAALLVAVAACHGATQSLPQQSTQVAPAPGINLVANASAIGATCKTPIKVGVDKDKTCHFTETGYKGTFTIDQNLGGVAVVRPRTGDRNTQFIVRGQSPGTGNFTVKDTGGHSLQVNVTVPQQPVISTCGRKIQIQIAGIVTCQFHEMGYDGEFTIDSHLNGIASVSPDHGDKHTQFTVLGLVEGGGYFIVHGGRNLRVRVLVTTP